MQLTIFNLELSQLKVDALLVIKLVITESLKLIVNSLDLSLRLG